MATRDERRRERQLRERCVELAREDLLSTADIAEALETTPGSVRKLESEMRRCLK